MSTPEIRERIEKLKANWLADPCFDLVDVADDEGLGDHKDELRAFQAEMEARWSRRSAERRLARIDQRIAKVAAKQVSGDLHSLMTTPGTAFNTMMRLFVGEIIDFEERLERLAGTAHERLDQIGAPRAASEVP